MPRIYIPLLTIALLPACEPKVVSPGEGSAGDDESESDAESAGDSESDAESAGDSGSDPTAAPESESDAECDDEIPPANIAPADDNGICDVQGEHRECRFDEQTMGTQFCDNGTWAKCLEAYFCLPGEIVVCFLCNSSFGTWWETCSLESGVPSYPSDACNTPLVLRTGTTPVEYHADPNRFAMTAADTCPTTDWPTAATPWLARDLDRSGTIDGGHELFGSGTRLGPTYARDGFTALAALDTDGDARITPSDTAWPELLLWFDHDGDRRSTLWELESLNIHAITAIDLHYDTTSRSCDPRGNCQVERAPVDSPVYTDILDLHLACQ